MRTYDLRARHVTHLLATSALLLSLAVTWSVPAHAVELSELPESTQDDIARLCLPVQYREGAAAYRNCVTSEVAARESNAPSAMNGLTFDEQYAVQQACASAGAENSAAYSSCLDTQLTALAKEPEPFLSDLTDDEAYALQQGCFAAQSGEGAGAYRQCVNRSLSELRQLPVPDLQALPLIERNALQLKCSASSASVALFRACLLDAVGVSAVSDSTSQSALSANTVQSPASQSPTSADSSAPTSGESPALITTAPVSNAPTVVNEPARLAASEAASAGSVTPSASVMTDREAAPVQNTGAGEVSTAPDGTVDESIGATDTAAEPVVNPAVQSPAQSPAETTGETSAEPGIGATLETTANPATDGTREPVTVPTPSDDGVVDEFETVDADLPGATGDADLADRTMGGAVNAAWGRLTDSVGKLEGVNRLLMFAALALPMLLLAAWAMLRNRPSPEYVAPRPSSALVERISPEIGTSGRLRPGQPGTRIAASTQPAHAHQDDAQVRSTHQRLHHQADALFEGDDAANAPTRLANRLDISGASAMNGGVSNSDRGQPTQRPAPDAGAAAPTVNRPGVPADLATANHTPDPADNAEDYLEPMTPEYAQTVRVPSGSAVGGLPRSGFGRWLLQQDANSQQSYCIEFLMYWMAYTDERYEPSLKAKLFKARDPGPNDRIKRTVLMRDVQAFADALSFLQQHAAHPRKVQIIDLLMALLVSDGALSPVQNTFLRFVGDAFGIGAGALEARYLQAFGQSMPPLPRVDKAAWWQHHDDEQAHRWDARAINQATTEHQYRIRLGLPLRGAVSETDVRHAFDRAIRRCDPGRFDQLEPRQRQLIAAQAGKLEVARDWLLGVTA